MRRMIMNEVPKMNGQEPPNIVEAAKAVVALSGWGKPAGAPPTCKAYMTSMMAVEVLRKAIQEHENPVLTLAPEPIPLDSPAAREGAR